MNFNYYFINNLQKEKEISYIITEEIG
jgi:hypothetical protein